jgi:hypothetical protein
MQQPPTGNTQLRCMPHARHSRHRADWLTSVDWSLRTCPRLQRCGRRPGHVIQYTAGPIITGQYSRQFFWHEWIVLPPTAHGTQAATEQQQQN